MYTWTALWALSLVNLLLDKQQEHKGPIGAHVDDLGESYFV